MENKSTISCLRQLLDEDTSRFISGEIQLKNSLYAWISKDNSASLKLILHKYIDMIDAHVIELEQFCKQEHITTIKLKNRIINAFIEEINEKLLACNCPPIKDACLLAGVQAINHFKISAYGTAAAFASSLYLDKAAALFRHAELNEKNIDQELNRLAESEINVKALGPLPFQG